MIPINELRFNNWVLDGFGNHIKIKDIISEGNTSGYKLDTLSPIPLSPEILEKAGFEKIKHIHGYEFWTNKKKRGEYYVPSIDIYEYKTEFQSNSVPHCKYLHELQNLYRWTTGQELTINLK